MVTFAVISVYESLMEEGKVANCIQNDGLCMQMMNWVFKYDEFDSTSLR